MNDFSRWTDRARRSLVLAQENARMMNHGILGTDHLLLGLLWEGGGVAFLALEGLGVTLDAATAAVARRRPQGRADIAGHIPLNGEARQLCDDALKEATGLNAGYVATEQVLLAMIRQEQCPGSLVLGDLGVSLLDVRAKVLELLAGYESAGGAGPAASPAPAPERVAVKLNPGLRIITITNTASEDEISFSESAWIAFIASVRNGTHGN